MISFAVEVEVVARPKRRAANSSLNLLSYLEALTFQFEHDGKQISAVLIYAEPDVNERDVYRFVPAADTGYEGIACVDDTARAVRLALRVYEQGHSRAALTVARRWLTFVEYMQYPDGSFANFIRNAAGIRNATGPTSHKGGYWWSARAMWALSTAYRLTGEQSYRERFEACHLDPISDGKILAVLALANLELYQADPSPRLRQAILAQCDEIVEMAGGSYFRDHPDTDVVSLWGYHQLHAVAEAARVLDEPRLIKPCRETVREMIEPDIRARMWYSFPDRRKNGVCAYTVTPIVEGLARMHRTTGAERYRRLALRAAAWFYGRNDADVPMYDPTTGRCQDGITDGTASLNCGAESSIEAGLAELTRRRLMAE